MCGKTELRKKIKDENLKRNEKRFGYLELKNWANFWENIQYLLKRNEKRELKIQTFVNGMQDWYSRRKIEDTRRII